MHLGWGTLNRYGFRLRDSNPKELGIWLVMKLNKIFTKFRSRLVFLEILAFFLKIGVSCTWGGVL